MASRRRISDEETAEFRRAMSGVRQLTDDRAPQPVSRPAPKPRRQALPAAVSDALMPDDPGPQPPGFGERQSFSRPGVQQRVLRKLARGQIPVDEELDLHGMRVDEARQALARFLEESRSRGRRCIRIITGKGFGSRAAAPVLKGQVDRWLRLRPEILAFCSATQRDGGTGAVYVLLRRSRDLQ